MVGLKGRGPRRVAVLGVVALAVLSESARAQDKGGDPLQLDRLSQMSLEQLMAIKVTSLEGPDREWFKTPASMYVITGEDVRRAGALNLPDALRLAPGVFVGQSGSSRWMVGTRGFNGALANKTLVMIDGRTVYDPLFGGTFWDVQEVPMQDLDRIEVIRGPGPSLWGQNAVNGVFNVVTKSARDTQGWYLSTIGGNWLQERGVLRYGGQIDDDTWFRVWSQYSNYAALNNVGGPSNDDAWDMFRIGFRADHDNQNGGKWTVDADLYTGTEGEIMIAPQRGQNFQFKLAHTQDAVSGGHILARIGDEDAAEHSGWNLQAYYDRTHRVIYDGFDVTRDTYDIELRTNFRPWEHHDLVAGVAARYTRDWTLPGTAHSLDPANEGINTISGFLQDTVTIVPDRLFFMGGSKVEYNNFTGTDAEPSARLWWTPDRNQTLWGSVSRAIRVPSRLEHQGTTAFAYIDSGLLAGGAPSGVIVPVGVVGNPDAQPEVIWAYETGYRRRITDDFTADLSLFYNHYDDLIFLPPSGVGTFSTGSADTYGGELALSWQVAPNWRLKGGYSFTKVLIHGDINTQDEGNTPVNMAQIRSDYDLTKDLQLNGALYFVDRVPAEGNPAYFRLDLGVTWHVNDHLELSAWGQNLLDPSHSEYTDPVHPGNPAEVPRSFYIQATLRF